MVAAEVFGRDVPKQPLHWTGERLTTEVHGPIEFEHYHRYLLARALCRGKTVLDVSSGEGYGSAFLAQVARSVIGVDVSQEAVDHASTAYVRANLTYVCGDALNLPLDDRSVEVVVSFETIEHLEGHKKFLQEIKRVLRPGGLVIISTPDREIYSPPGSPPNPFHARELNRREFSRLLARYFKHSTLLLQRTIAGSAIAPEIHLPRTPASLVFERQDEQFKSTRAIPEATYLVALASDAAVPSVGDSLYIDRDYFRHTAEDIQRTSEELKLARADAREARKEVQALLATDPDHSDNQMASQALDLMAEARADLARRLDEMSAQAAQLNEVRLSLASQIAAADANAAHAVNNIAALEATRADLARQLGEARAGATELAAARDRFQRQLDEARVQAQAAELKLQAAEAKGNQDARQVERLHKDLDEVRSRIAELLAGRDAQDSRIEEARARASDLAMRLSRFETTRANLTRQLGETRARANEALQARRRSSLTSIRRTPKHNDWH